MLRRRIKLNRIKWLFKRWLRVLAENSFLTSIFFILLALVLGALVFYKYSFLVEKEKWEITEKPFSLQEEIIQEVLKIWQEREKRFRETDFKTYPDPFSVD